MSNYNEQVIQNDEVSLKELILLVKKYFLVLLKQWWKIGIIGVLFGLLFVFFASRNAATYKATLTYTSNEGGGMSGLGGLLGGFLKKGSSNTLVKAQAMTTTQKIGQDALFKKAYIDGELDYLINHHGRIYEVKDFVLFKNDSLATEEERKTFKNITKVIYKNLLSQSVDDDTNLAQMSINSLSEEYSIELTEAYYKSIVTFYQQTEVGQQKVTLKALQLRADSIYADIQNTVYGIAKIKDNDKGIFWAVDKVPKKKATTELTFLSTAYQEIVKNLETIKFTVASNTPSITAIDYPTTPIKPQKASLIIKAITGVFIGCFLASLFILGRKILSDILEDDDNSHLVTD